MRKMILFAGQQYYPEGGGRDFVSAHQTVEEAVAATETLPDDWVDGVDWAHVMDARTGEILIELVRRGERTENVLRPWADAAWLAAHRGPLPG